MPTYQYACSECGHRFDAVQKFTDDSLTVCPACGGVLRKVYGSIGVVFKGSGFYRTDSRSGPAVATADAGAAKSDSGGDSKKSSDSDAGSGSSGGSDSSAKSSPSAPASTPSSTTSAGSSSSGSSSSTSTSSKKS